MSNLDRIEIREEPDAIALATRAVEEMRAASEARDTRVAADLAARDARITALETRLNRPAIVNAANLGDGPSLAVRARECVRR